METLEEQLSCLHIANRSAMEDSMTYVLDIDTSEPAEGQQTQVIAILCSNKSIRLYNKESMTFLHEYNEHPAVLSGVRFSHSNGSVLYSACSDGTVKSWDARTSGAAPVQLFNGYPANAFISFDISCNDLVLCAGTEKEEEDSFLVFWDARAPNGKFASKDPLGVYSESHNDDITQVRFHPTNPSMVASGSTDGLVNVFDLSKDNEDDALSATCNSDSSVNVLGWAGEDHKQIFCLTHDEGFYRWDLAHVDTDEPITLSKVQDVREHASGCTVDYLIGGFYRAKEDALLLVGGTHSGDISLLNCDADRVKHLYSLRGGHSATVRSFYWNAEDDSLLTGGEDAQLLLWKPRSKDVPQKKEPLKMASSLQQRVRVHHTKSYKTKQKQ
ncbi:WD repeat-containing protein 89 [Spea bombifrons]|uniref:WD repeat-containing protein 89 n=1 Tax=Spea bombifrons TaxID=233779 RepID=UPI00234BF4C8|nr:WD repeat-containing protein 89 [Spea bombifrons]